MKRWLLATLVLIVVVISVAVLWPRVVVQATAFSSPHVGLMRTANSAYKYDLCTEAYAYAHASPDNPYKTNYTFPDPFRKTNDTIIPLLLDYDQNTRTVSFSVEIIVDQVAVFQQTITQVHELDGISIILPDRQNQLHRSGVPQFIVSSIGHGHIAVLDYTCPAQWVWKMSE